MKAFLGKKLGMSTVYDSYSNSIPVTVVDVSNNYITRVFESENHFHLELGKDKKKRITKPETGMYSSILGFVPSFRTVLTFKKSDKSNIFLNNKSLIDIKPGEGLFLENFVIEGMNVTVTGKTKGKGFAGVVKRYRMKGGPRTHGQSDRERSVGSIGMRTIPGRVFKGKRMPGHMGVKTKTIKGLKIIKYDKDTNCILVSGAVPGPNNSYLIIRSN